MRILITGSTGFVGKEIVRQLGDCQLRILARSPSAIHSKAEVVGGSVQDPKSLQKACEGIDAIIHLVGIIAEAGRNTYQTVHAEGTASLVQAALESGVKRFIHMSALGTRPNARSRYHQTKWEAEEIVRGSGLSYTIFRPSIIYGPEDQFLNLFARIIRMSPLLPIIGDGRNRMQPVPVYDVARAFVGSLRHGETAGKTLNLCGPDILTFEEILDSLMALLGRHRMKIHIPWAVANIQACLLESVFKLLRRAPPLNRDQILMLQEDNVGKADEAEKLFGLTNVPFRKGIEYLRR